jgi:hypothetical protein
VFFAQVIGKLFFASGDPTRRNDDGDEVGLSDVDSTVRVCDFVLRDFVGAPL